MKKMFKLGVLVIGLLGVLNLKSVLLGTMDVVDFVGEKLNVSTVEQIDFLNEVYYSVFEK